MLHYCQMTTPERFYFDHDKHVTQRAKQLSSASIQEGKIYWALSKLLGSNTAHDAVAFPVGIETLARPRRSIQENPLAPIAIIMTQLDQDFMVTRNSNNQPIQLQAIIRNGIWKLHHPTYLKNDGEIEEGFFVLTPPDPDYPDIRQIDAKERPDNPEGNVDPRSIY